MQNRVAGNNSTTDFESSATGQKPNGRAGKKNSHAAIQCHTFAGSDFKCLKIDYIVDTLYSGSMIRPLTSHIRGAFSSYLRH